jgi:hypothetical protein
MSSRSRPAGFAMTRHEHNVASVRLGDDRDTSGIAAGSFAALAGQSGTRSSPTSRVLSCSSGSKMMQCHWAARAGMTQPALSRLEAGGVVPTISLLERISMALDADLIVEIAPHAALTQPGP